MSSPRLAFSISSICLRTSSLPSSFAAFSCKNDGVNAYFAQCEPLTASHDSPLHNTPELAEALLE